MAATGWMKMFSIKWPAPIQEKPVSPGQLDKLSNSGALWSPRSDWEKHLSYRVDPLWGEHNHNVKQVRLNTILLLSFPDGMMLICSSAKVLMWPGQEVRRSSQKSKKMSKGLASPSSMGNVTMCQRGPIEPNSLIHMTLGHTTVLWWLSQMSRRGLVWGGRKLTPWPTTWQTLATLSLVPVCH